MYAIDVDVSGPLFDGRIEPEVSGYALEARQEVAQQALSEVQQLLDRAIKFPTPYYETQVVHQMFASADVVHDRDIVYGPWLEGTSQRNLTTRFKGYHSFRLATQAIEGNVDAILETVLQKYIRRMN